MTVLTTIPNGALQKDIRDTINAMLADVAGLKGGAVTPTPSPTLAALSLAANSITENAASGTVVGGILGKTSGSTLSLFNNDGGRFDISGTNLVAGQTSTDYEAGSSRNIVLRETLTGATNSPRDTPLSVGVVNVNEQPSLRALLLSSTSLTVGTSASGAIAEAATGSTITATGLPAGYTVNGPARTWAYDGSGPAATSTVTLTETLGDSPNSPRATQIGVTVAAANGAPTFNVAPYDFTGNDSFFAASEYTSVTAADFNSARHPTDDYLDIKVDTWFQKIAISGVDNWMFSRWGGDNSYIFTQSRGNLAMYFIDKNGNASYPESTAALSTVTSARERLQVRCILNASTNTINGRAPGTLTFMYSRDGGTTWTQLGNVVTVGTNGIKVGSLPGKVGGGQMNGRIYRVIVTDGAGKILYNPDFRAQAVGSYASFTDTGAVPATWNNSGFITCDLTPRATSYPRLKASNTWKMKTFEILPDAQFSAAVGDWGKLWANYPNAQFAERIAYAKSQGANTAKWTCSGSRVTYESYPSFELLEQYIAAACVELRKNGLYLYLSLAHSDELMLPDGTGRDTRIPDIVRTAALWMKYGADLIIGGDAINEVQFGFAPATLGLAGNGRPTTWGAPGSGSEPNQAFSGDIAYFYKALRTVMPDVPLSFSVYMDSKDRFLTSRYFIQQAVQGMSFHDYHPYNSQNNLSSASDANPASFPKLADISVLEGLHSFIGVHAIGECGFQRRNTTQNKQDFYAGLIAQGTSAKSLGWVAFGDYDYTSNNESGDYGIRQDATFTTSFAGAPNYTIA